MDNLPHLLIIGAVWPEPNSSAAGQRMMQLINIFKLYNWEITFAATAGESVHRADLEALGISSQLVEINSSIFDDFIAELQPDAVLFDRFMAEEQFGWRVAEQCPETLRILDTEDLHCLRRSRRAALQENREWTPQELLENDTAKREMASIWRSDCSLIISEFEMVLLQDLFDVDAALMHYLPFILDPIETADTEKWRNFWERGHFVTIGNFRHPPNMDAVNYLSSSIWPLIRQQLPQAELHVYGAYPSQRAEALHQPARGFLIKGRAKSSTEVMQNARVCLAPLRFGAGLKGKFVEAMQCGTPSVTTAVGAEGIAGKHPWPGALAEEPEQIAAEAVKLYTDSALWNKMQQRGVVIINNRFSAGQFAPAFMKHINQLLANLRQHRRVNFTGAMLMHHTMASTEYMSRWIEEKNKD